jgi:AGZA family xanthine/uracil permease-like MFS transporter
MAAMEATTADRAPSGGSPVANRLDRYFDITARGSSIPTEICGGAATFLTMAYILFVNPQILGSVAAPGGVKLPFDQLLTVTALVAAIATLAMGIYGRYPFALAAGLGINAFVAFSLVGADRLSWPDAMGVVVAEGLAITVLASSASARRSSTPSPTTSSSRSGSASASSSRSSGSSTPAS